MLFLKKPNHAVVKLHILTMFGYATQLVFEHVYCSLQLFFPSSIAGHHHEEERAGGAPRGESGPDLREVMAAAVLHS